MSASDPSAAPGATALEVRIHGCLAPWCVGGEWFEPIATLAFLVERMGVPFERLQEIGYEVVE